MSKVLFTDCVDLVGQAPKRYIGEKIYISTGAVDCNVIDQTQIETVTYDNKPSRANLVVEAEDILFAKMQNTHKVLLVNDKTKEYLYSTGFCAVRAKKQFLSKECLFYLLNSPQFLKQKDKFCSGATQKAITNEALSKLTVCIPEISEQEYVVKNLDKINGLIEKRKRQLEKLDLLIKSQFIETFGDPEQNPQEWEKVKITKIVGGEVSNGFFAKREAYVEDGNIAVMGVAHIVNRMYSQWTNLPKTNATNKDIEKYEVRYGDMLFCRSSLVAEGIGKASIVPEDVAKQILFECHVIRVPLDLKKCIPEFVQVLSTTDYFRRQIISQSKTATMTTIGQDGILKTEIILPPLEKQKAFYNFIKQNDKLKIAINQSLEKLETLKKALIQKYFG